MQLDKKQFDHELLSLAIPLALQSLLTALVGASDALMLGRLNEASVAAVSLANQAAFIMGLFLRAVVGAADALMSQYRGKGDEENVSRFMSLAVRASFLTGTVFFLAAFLMPGRIMSFFTKEEEMISIGADYLRIVSFSYLFNALSQPYLTAMQIDGRVKESVAVSAMTVIVDMTVDFFLIYGIGGVPALGANGSAYSTIAVEALALAWCLFSSRKKGCIRPAARYLRGFSGNYERDLWRLILPMLASSLSWGLSITAHSFLMGHCGTDAAAAYAVTDVAQQLTQGMTLGLTTGASILIGKLLGSNRLEEAKACGDRCRFIALLCGIFNVALLGAVGRLVYVFYVLEPLAKQYLTGMLLYSMLYMFAYSFNTIFAAGIFPAGGDAMYDAVSVGIATWLLALPISMAGEFLFGWPVMAVYMVMCMDEIIKVPAMLLYGRRYVWLKNMTRDEG